MATAKYAVRFTDPKNGETFVQSYPTAGRARKIAETFRATGDTKHISAEYLGPSVSARRGDTALLKRMKHQHPYRG